MKKKNRLNIKEVVKTNLYNSSPIISEAYPSVSSISIKKTYYDDSSNNQIGEIEVWNLPITTMRMYVDIKCILRSCIDGGFEITSDIISMIGKKETQRKSKLVCQGWQDEERVGHYYCLSTLEYEINITYK